MAEKRSWAVLISVTDTSTTTHYPAQNKVFWRDTHLAIEGPGVQYLQYLFVCDWNFCAGIPLENVNQYFPTFSATELPGNKIIQIAASGPDSESPTILYSLLYAIYQAQEEILVTTPYFIPEQSVLDALVMAALGGVTVKLLVPEKGDSKLVELAANSYYEDLLDAGCKVIFLQKGICACENSCDRQTTRDYWNGQYGLSQFRSQL